MKSFIKMFFAAFLAITGFFVLAFFLIVGIVSSAVQKSPKQTVASNSVLVLDLSSPLREQAYINPLNVLLRNGTMEVQGLQDVTREIRDAAQDDRIRGIFIKMNGDPNGFATSQALRGALLDFKHSGKFIYAYGEEVPQKAYYVASVADKIFLNPQGVLDFSGFSVQIMFFKGLMDKLGIQAQVFFDGKFKSATEPYRVTQMTPANKIQTTEFLSTFYQQFLEGISQQRHIDTANLHDFANKGLVRSANDAVKLGLVDATAYNDQVLENLKERLGLSRADHIHFVSMSAYNKSDQGIELMDKPKIAVLYAQGDIINGSSYNTSQPEIAAQDYIRLIRSIRNDSSIKALVFRVNSPGGSALAADEIWRELELTKQVKPVVVSMGDYAASGGYYISCMADSIFAEPTTLTGSIGVFGIIPNLQSFFRDKLGITFDGVKTAQYADMGSMTRPLTDAEKTIIQSGVDSIYATFKSRVARGRNLPEATVDSIAQGRVWSGLDAVKIGLVDRLGGMRQAIACAARLASLKTYSLKQYPQTQMPFNRLIGNLESGLKERVMQEELGSDYGIFKQLKEIRGEFGHVEAKLPYSLDIR